MTIIGIYSINEIEKSTIIIKVNSSHNTLCHRSILVFGKVKFEQLSAVTKQQANCSENMIE